MDRESGGEGECVCWAIIVHVTYVFLNLDATVYLVRDVQ